jgi:pimeloyl-ACP methyl ester carboxylesterase
MPRTLVAPPSFVPPGRFVDLPGRGTTFIREAPGPVGAPTVVLLHGLGATGGLNWLWCFEPLSSRYRGSRTARTTLLRWPMCWTSAR